MADLSSYSFTGRVVREPEIKQVNGKNLVEIDVANNVGFGDYKYTNWLKVKWWGDRAVNAAPIFTKGTLVTGEGTLKLDTWKGKDDVEHTNIIVTVSGLDVLHKPDTGSKDSDGPVF